MRLLLVEDDNRLAFVTIEGLKAATGFAIDHVASIDEAKAALATTEYDALILDLGLPDGDGQEILITLRRAKNMVPILILTARDGLSDRVRGLNLGADDYLLKPYAMEELIARIHAMLRRPGGALGIILECGGLRYDTIHQQVSFNSKNISLSKRELALLEQLMRNNGNVVTKSLIEDRLYGFDDDIGSNAVEVHIHRLRKKLSAYDDNIKIATIRGVGYILSEV